MTKPTTITVTIEISEIIDATIGATDGDSEDDRAFAEMLATGVRALIVKNREPIIAAERIYRLGKEDIVGPNRSTARIEQIMNEAEVDRLIERLAGAEREPNDLLH